MPLLRTFSFLSVCLGNCFIQCPFSSTLYPSSLLIFLPFQFYSDIDLCGKHVSKRPYGELGSVDRSTCLCCISVESAFGPISPGCGCDTERVDEIVMELKQRMRQRGDTAQIQRTEETLQRLTEVETKLVCGVAVCSVFLFCGVLLHQNSRTFFEIFLFCAKDLIIDHFNIPKPDKMTEREVA